MKCMYNIINIHHIKSIQKTSIFSCLYKFASHNYIQTKTKYKL